MNGYQKFLAIITIILATASTIYLPWEYTFQDQGISQVVKPAGYHLIFSPPEPQSFLNNFGVRVDLSRCLIQLLGVGIFFGGGFYLLEKDT